MGTQEMPTEVIPAEEPAPLPVAPTIPSVGNGPGTYGSLTTVVAAVAAFIIGWAQYGLTPEVVTLGAAAAGVMAAWYGGRSIQAKAIIDKVISSYQEHADLGDVGGVPPEWTPPAEGEDAEPADEIKG